MNFRHLAALYLVFAVLCVMSLSACGEDNIHSMPPPAVVVKTVTVTVPIPTPCVDPAQVPVMPPKHGGEMTGVARHDLDIAVAAASELRAALDQALALLGACVTGH